MPGPGRKIGAGLVSRLLTQSIGRGTGGFYSSKRHNSGVYPGRTGEEKGKAA